MSKATLDRGSAEPVVNRDELDEHLAAQLVEHARAQGTSLVGPDGLLAKLTKLVFETGLEAEMSEHLGYEPYEVAGRGSGNSRNGSRSKTVTTEIGPLELEVPRDRDGSFEPTLVRKRQRRLTGVDDMVCSLVAKGLTTGEVSAHLAEVYGAQVWKGHDQPHQRPCAGGYGRVAQPPAGSGLSGDLHRLHRGQDP